MTSFVVDASVAIKWVVEEEGTASALVLLEYRLVAPDLLIAECANILWKKIRRAELTEPEGLLAAQLLERAGIELVPARHLLYEATRLAVAMDHPAYDCIYLAVAKAHGLCLMTADRRLAARVRERGIDVEVLTLPASAQELQNVLARETGSRNKTKEVE